MCNVVVFEIADERGRHDLRVACKKDSGSRDTLHAVQQALEVGTRQRHSRKDRTQVCPAVAPGRENAEQQHSKRERDPPAMVDLGQIASEVNRVRNEKEPEYRDHRPIWPTPLLHRDKRPQDRGNDHRTHDGDTIGIGQCVG